MMFPNSDCKNTAGGETHDPDGPDNTSDDPSCWTAPPAAFPPGNKSAYPHIGAADYSQAERLTGARSAARRDAAQEPAPLRRPARRARRVRR